MSYDLTIVRPREGESAEAAKERIGGEEAEPRENGPAERERKREVVAAILAAAPMLRYEDGGLGIGDGPVEMTDQRKPGAGLQVTVFEDDYVSVAVPYGPRGDEALRVVRRMCEALEKRWGMKTYDPQFEQEVEWGRDNGDMTKLIAGVAGRMGELVGGAGRGKRWWEFWK